MASMQFLAVFLFSSWVFVGSSQGVDSLVQGGHSVVGLHDGIPTCMQKILPCQQYLKSLTNPPPSCCLPLKQILADDLKCLCSVFMSPDLLKALNVTQSEALKLPRACGADVDMSTCKNEANPPTDSTTTPPPPATASNGSSSKRSSSTRNSPAYGVGCGVAAAALLASVRLGSLVHFN